MSHRECEALTQVLGSARLTDGRDLASSLGESVIAAAADALAPLVASVREARGEVGEAWDGYLHRRVRWRPAPPGTVRGSSAAGHHETGEVSPLTSRSWRRGAWDLTTVTTRLDAIEVTHELARRADVGRMLRGVSRLQSPPPEPAGLGSWADGDPVRSSAAGSVRAGEWQIEITPDLLERWTSVSGDDNVIHRVPGAGAACGLPAGGDGLIAHGMLLLGLSACLDCVPLAGEARFVSPLPVPPGGCVVRQVRDDAGAWVGLEGSVGVVLRVRPL